MNRKERVQANFVTIRRIITCERLYYSVDNASLAEWLRSRLQSGVSRFNSGDWLSFFVPSDDLVCVYVGQFRS